MNALTGQQEVAGKRSSVDAMRAKLLFSRAGKMIVIALLLAVAVTAGIVAIPEYHR